MNNNNYIYKTNIKNINENGDYIINLDDLRNEDIVSFNYLTNNPKTFLNILNNDINHKLRDSEFNDLNFGNKFIFEGNLGKNFLIPQEISTKYLNKLICIKGIVLSINKTYTRLIKSTQYSNNKNNFKMVEYDFDDILESNNNQENMKFLISNNKINQYDENNKPLLFEFGKSKFINVQTILLQDIPESLKNGQTSRVIEIRLLENNCDNFIPGDKIFLFGILKIKNNNYGFSKGIFNYYIDCFNGYTLNYNISKNLNIDSIKIFKELSKLPNLFDIIANSFGPSLFGLNIIKKAIILQLIGSNEKIINNKKLRDKIHILLLGEPATGKSQILRITNQISEIGINTTGRGVSGVGLTACIKKEKVGNERQIEAGAMVLCDKGLICIDEFDKMNNEDVILWHEAMEQQTITLDKAGIHLTLNARCSVLAAGNPIYSDFLENLSLLENIGMNESLLSRFDLIFILKDLNNYNLDTKLASHIIKNHQYKCDNYFSKFIKSKNNDENLLKNNDNNILEENEINEILNYEISNNLETISTDLLKKYIIYAKTMKPEMTENSRKIIQNFWVELRIKKNNLGINIGIRHLESLIRLATASAKLYLRKKIIEEDCNNAFEIFNYSLNNEFNKINSKNYKNKKQINKTKKKETKKRARDKKDPVFQEKVKILFLLIADLKKEPNYFNEGIELKEFIELIKKRDKNFFENTNDLNLYLKNIEDKDLIVFDKEKDKIYLI